MKTSSVSAGIAANVAVALASASWAAAPTFSSVKAGAYQVESYHTQVQFSLNHFGFTNYSGMFSGITGRLQLNPANPGASKLDINIPMDSILTTVPPLTDLLKGAQWFDATKYPQATFTSTKVDFAPSGELTIAGNLTLHGVTKPVILHAHLLGAGLNPLDKVYTVGFQAQGTIKRSEFGVSLYVPAVGDDVDLTIAGAFELES